MESSPSSLHLSPQDTYPTLPSPLVSPFPCLPLISCPPSLPLPSQLPPPHPLPHTHPHPHPPPQVEATLGIPVDRQRYWTWLMRANRSFRVDKQLEETYQDKDLCDLHELRERVRVGCVGVWVCVGVCV